MSHLLRLKVINSRLLNVESIDAMGGSTLDLSSAKPASRSFDNAKTTVKNIGYEQESTAQWLKVLRTIELL